MPGRSYLTARQIKTRKSTRKPVVNPGKIVTRLPSTFSLVSKCPPPYDQGQLGSCTANALCGALSLQSNNTFRGSRLFIYFQGRLAEDPTHNPADLTDSGADVVDEISYAKSKGICTEVLWPYDISQYNTPPPPTCYTQAAEHKIKSYAIIPINAGLLSTIKSYIAKGSPVLIAIEVYASFESASVAETGKVPIPNPVNWNDPSDPQDAYLGGHEMLCVGYNDTTQLFTVLNSWGTGWGIQPSGASTGVFVRSLMDT